MNHFQRTVSDWPEAVARLPEGSLVKAVDQGDILRDAKIINPGVITMLRHVGGPQVIFWGDFESNKQLARDFFETFIDETFRREYAPYVDLIQEWNEYIASSDTEEQIQQRLTWAEAAAWVWKNEYRTQSDYKDIRLVLCSTAVGNNIDRRFAEIASHYDCVMSYHAYDKFLSNKERDPHSWQFHCGRWDTMDRAWSDLRIDWLFGEAGPYGSVEDGWRSSKVLGGDREAYVSAVRTWIREIAQTNAYREGRVLGFALFTTGRTSGGWEDYYTEQPELNMLADMIAQEWNPGDAPPPPPPPPPPPIEVRRYVKTAHIVPQGVPRRLFDAVVDSVWDRKQSVFFSIDDALQPAANSNLVDVSLLNVVVWNVEQVLGRPEDEAKAALNEFAEIYYPDPGPIFSYKRLGSLFVADRWASPVGTPGERASDDLWPGLWVDANPFLNLYRLGNNMVYHTGADLNLNFPAIDMDRNKPVYAAASGKVVYAGVPSNAWQGVVIVRHQVPDGSFAFTRYAHLQEDEIVVEKEDWVKVGEILGLTGRNMVGDTPGPFHLHFDVGITSRLNNDPGDWPGGDRERVVRHYTDPLRWIRDHR